MKPNRKLEEAMKELGYTDKTLATALGVTNVTVYRWRKKGVLPRKMRGKDILQKLIVLSDGKLKVADFYL